MLKSIITNSVIITGMIVLSLYFPRYGWFVNFIMIILGILVIITYATALTDKDEQEKLYKYYDEHNYKSIVWRLYDSITDIITVAVLVYFDYRVAASFIVIGFLLAYNFKKRYYGKETKNES